MTTLAWIVASGLGMSAIALVGSAALLLSPERLQHVLLPLVAFAAGTLLGGALLHMVPGAIALVGPRLSVFVWVLVGFTLFFGLEQFLHWHHSHRGVPEVERKPLTYLVLIGDGLHNFLGGLAVATAFMADVRLGLGAWLAAYAVASRVDLTFLLPLAAGNFLYIAASDLVPEVKMDKGVRHNVIHLFALVSGMALLYLLRVVLEP